MRVVATTSSTLDLQAAAHVLGVHYQTAYRWVRSGRLPAVRVQGRYVVDPADLDQLVAERTTPSELPAPSADRLARSAERVADALISGDEAAVRHLARRLVDEGAPLIDLIEKVLVPPLRMIGDAWARGELSIWVEHRASAIVDRVLGDVVPNPRGRRRGTAVVAAVSGDQHVLPTTMAAVVLRADQWNVHHLGADVPADDLIECCQDSDVDLAVITVTNPDVAAEADRIAALAERAGIRVLLGGPDRTLDELVSAARSSLGPKDRS